MPVAFNSEGTETEPDQGVDCWGGRARSRELRAEEESGKHGHVSRVCCCWGCGAQLGVWILMEGKASKGLQVGITFLLPENHPGVREEADCRG